jgi:hypothetical protein
MKAPPSLVVAGHLLTLPIGYYISVNFYIETSFALLFRELTVLRGNNELIISQRNTAWLHNIIIN